MSDAVAPDRFDDRAGVHPAHADVDAGPRCQRPGKAPSIAVEHRQRPEIDRMLGHVPFENVGDDVGGGSAVVVHPPLGISCRSARVVERYGVPLVLRQLPRASRTAFGHQVFVGQLADAFGRSLENRILRVDHEHRLPALAKSDGGNEIWSIARRCQLLNML